MNKSYKILLILFIAIVIAGIGLYIYSKYFLSQANLAEETTEWQLYTNDQYGFSFKYPKSWTLNITEKPLLSIFLSSPEMQDMMAKRIPDASPEISLEIKSNPEKISLEEIIENDELYIQGTKLEILIAGRKGYRAEFSGMVNSTVYFWENRSNILSLSAWSQHDVQEKILSTFKFYK